MRLFLPFLALVILVVSQSCKKPVAFNYRDIKNFRLDKFGMDKSKVSMDLVYFNPNNFGVNLKNVSCDIFIDSMYIGKFALDTLMHIPRSSEFTLPASFEVDMSKVLQSSVNLLFNEVKIGARGTTKVGKGGLFINVPINYEGKHKLNLF